MANNVLTFRNDEEKFVAATVNGLTDIIQKVESGEFRTVLNVCYSPEDGVVVYYAKPEGTSIYELLGYVSLVEDYLKAKAAGG